jgi:hypothetical protein
MSQAAIAAGAAVLAATLGAVLTYVYAQRLRRQQAQLDRVNAQLAELYGPLYANLEASRIAHRRLVELIRPKSDALFGPGIRPAPLPDAVGGTPQRR